MYLNMTYVYTKLYKAIYLKNKSNRSYVLYFLEVPNTVSPVKAKEEPTFFCLAGQQTEESLPWLPPVLGKSGPISRLHYKKEVSLVQNQS